MITPSAAPVITSLLITGACTRPYPQSWTGPTFIGLVISAIAFLVSLASFCFSVYSWRWVHRRKLVLDQTGNRLTDVILEASSAGPTIYQLTVAVINASPATTIVIREFCLKLPWEDELFDLLDDPRVKVPTGNDYKFAETSIQYSRQQVINHQKNAEGVLPPGKVIEGRLLAYSPNPIPQEYRHQKDVQVELLVSDETAETYRHTFTMSLNLGRK